MIMCALVQSANTTILTVSLLQLIFAFPQSKLMAVANLLSLGHDQDGEIDMVLSHGFNVISDFILKHVSSIVQDLFIKEPRDTQLILALYRLYFLEDIWKVSVWRSVLGGIGDRIQVVPATGTITVIQVRRHLRPPESCS